MQIISGAMAGMGSFLGGRKIGSGVKHAGRDVRTGLQIIANSMNRAVDKADTRMLETLAEFSKSREAIVALGNRFNDNTEGFVEHVGVIVDIAREIHYDIIPEQIERINGAFITARRLFTSMFLICIIVTIVHAVIIGSMINPDSGSVLVERVLNIIYAIIDTIVSYTTAVILLIICFIIIVLNIYDTSRRNSLTISLFLTTRYKEECLEEEDENIVLPTVELYNRFIQEIMDLDIQYSTTSTSRPDNYIIGIPCLEQAVAKSAKNDTVDIILAEDIPEDLQRFLLNLKSNILALELKTSLNYTILAKSTWYGQSGNESYPICTPAYEAMKQVVIGVIQKYLLIVNTL